MRFKPLKAQSSVESLAMISLFIALLVPMSLYFFSQVGSFSNTADDESIRLMLLSFKTSVESVYASCPSSLVVNIKWPASVEKVVIKKDGGIRVIAFAKRDGKEYSIEDVVAVKDVSNVIVDPNADTIIGSGVVGVRFTCSPILGSDKFVIGVEKVVSR